MAGKKQDVYKYNNNNNNNNQNIEKKEIGIAMDRLCLPQMLRLRP